MRRAPRWLALLPFAAAACYELPPPLVLAPVDADVASADAQPLPDIPTSDDGPDLPDVPLPPCEQAGQAHPGEDCAICGEDGEALPCPIRCGEDGHCLRIAELALGAAGYVRLKDGTVWSWRALASSIDDPLEIAPPAVVELPGPALDLAAGEDHACVVIDGGKVLCWGKGNRGQLGAPTPRSQPTPVQAQIDDVASIHAGWDSTCAIRLDGRVLCWGRTLGAEEAGKPLPAWDWKPKEVPLPAAFVATDVSVGRGHACALGTGDPASLWCWGDDSAGQLRHDGVGGAAPVAPLAEGVIERVAAAGFCTLATGGGGSSVLGWGTNSYGGLGTLTSQVVSLHDLSGLFDMPLRSLHAGGGTVCGITTDSQGYCWGSGVNAKLGDGEITSSATPVAVDLELELSQIRVSPTPYLCFVTMQGTLWCRGFGYSRFPPDEVRQTRIEWPADE